MEPLAAYDATLSIQGSPDTLKISNFFPGYSNISYGLFSRIEFADGTVWGQTEINSHFLMAGGGSSDLSYALGNSSIAGSDDNDRIIAIDGNDTVWGGLGKDLIYGGDGGDQLWGGRMDDTLYGEAGSDYLYGERGNDYLFGDAGQDVLDGGVGDDTLNGGAGADTIDGGTGADRLVGGDGDDVYVVDDKNDVVIETAMFDWDKVQTYVDYVLPDGVEYLDLLGSADLNGWSNNYGDGGILMGNDGSNHLYGGVDTDFLDGGNDGIDTLEGGDGDDFYTVASADVVILEGSGVNSGHDVMEVISVSAITMADNVEDAIASNKYFGLRATGNKLDNLMTGANMAADVIKGAAGNDTLKGLGNNDALTGGIGDDSLLGGTGSDKYYFSRGDGKDVVVETQAAGSSASSNDSIIYTGAVATTDLWLSRQGNDLQLDLLGGNDQIKVTNWFKVSSYQVENISLLGAGKSLNVAGINQLVSAMAQFAPPTSGLSSLSATQRSQVESAIAANWR